MAEADAIPLPHRSRGEGGPAIVLLHGFGADRLSFSTLLKALSQSRRTIAFDLPGHGAAAAWSPVPGAADDAKAVIASLDAMGIQRAAIVGHSLGGAVASLVGLMRPDLVDRLILLAPGGFGPEMNAAALRRYAEAVEEADIAPAIEPFFGPAMGVPDGFARVMAEQRRDEVLRASHRAIVEVIARGDGQGTLPLDRLADSPFPVSLVWGLDDGVLPAEQAINAPAEFARHLLPGVGHMPHLEAPDVVLRIVERTILGALASAD